MKTLKLIVIAGILFLVSSTQAQVSVSVNFSPPPWGPVGYNQVRYYYLPDVEAYYDVQSSMFIYSDGRTWVHRAYLPARYHDYDLYGGYKVVMKDYHGNTPYMQFMEHKRMYARGYRGEPQRTMRERPGGRENNSHQVNRGNHGENHGNQGVNRGNQGVNRGNQGVNHGNQGTNRGNQGVNQNNKSGHHSNGNNVRQGNNRGNSHGNDKNMKNDHGHDNGNGRK
jgi:hypothetical protein